jgi:putative FmdB family regulatory protein
MSRCKQVLAGGARERGAGAAAGTLRVMPLYDYRCRACGHTTEELRSPDLADAPARCVCGGDDTVRLPSLVARRGAAVGSELPMAGGGGSATTGGGGCCGGGCCG